MSNHQGTQVSANRQPGAKPVTVGVIGAGYWGAKHVRNFGDLPDAHLAWVADLDPKHLSAVARQFPHVRTTTNHHDLLEAADLDAVVIATPAATHVPLAAAAFRAGKHVLVEKPLATSVAGAEELIALAEENDRVLMVGHTFLFNPAVRMLRDLVQRQELGEIYYAHAQRLNLGLFQRDVNVLWDLAPHDISIFMYLLGSEPTAASARAFDYVQPGIQDVGYLDLEFPNRVRAGLHVSWLDPNKVRNITLVGSRKMAVYDDVATLEKIRVYDKGVDGPPPTDNFGEFQLSYRYGHITIPHIASTEPLRLECAHFLDCIRDGTTPISDGPQGLAVVRVLEAAQTSLRRGGAKLSLPTRRFLAAAVPPAPSPNHGRVHSTLAEVGPTATTCLEDKVRQREATVAIMGLGYAGLPMAIEVGRAGFAVLGYDVDATKIDRLERGLSPVTNVADSDVQNLVESGGVVFTTDPLALEAADVAIICVPTPLTADGDADLRYVRSAAETLARHAHDEMLVILQSTVPPGTTRRLVGQALHGSTGLGPRDPLVAFAPERIDPGNDQYTVSNTPKLVGGVSAEATRIASLFFKSFIGEVVSLDSPEVAEMAKLFENTFRLVNISLVNELALICDPLKINVWDVIEAAKTKPFAFMAHYPSAGVGGHCIPVVPRYLEAISREHGVVPEVISAARRVNQVMPSVVVDKLELTLAARGRDLAESRVLLVGITYKPDIADVRESAAVRVLEELIGRRAQVEYHDPLIPSLKVDGRVLRSIELSSAQLGAFDAVVLLTAHTSINYDRIVRDATLVFDTRSGLRAQSAASNVVNMWIPSAASDPAAVLVRTAAD